MSNSFAARFFKEKVQELKDQGVYKDLPILQSANDAEVILNGRKIISLCSNNYLGLVNHPRIKMADRKSVV